MMIYHQTMVGCKISLEDIVKKKKFFLYKPLTLTHPFSWAKELPDHTRPLLQYHTQFGYNRLSLDIF